MNLKQLFGRTETKKAETFEKIIGNEDAKSILRMTLESASPVNLLVNGPPGIAKTELLRCILMKYPEQTEFVVGPNCTEAGINEVLFVKRPKYFIIDEIEKVPKKVQNILLSILQGGLLKETKVSKMRETQLKTWVFATSNSLRPIIEPLQSRFAIINLKQYDEVEFRNIAAKVLERENAVLEITDYIIEQVFTKYRNPDMRDIIFVGRTAKTKADVDTIIRTMGRN
jgi:MoxR-like ATPase